MVEIVDIEEIDVRSLHKSEQLGHLKMIVQKYVNETLDKHVEFEQDLGSIGINSIKAQTVKGLLEENMDIPLPQTLFAQYRTIGAIASHIAHRLKLERLKAKKTQEKIQELKEKVSRPSKTKEVIGIQGIELKEGEALINRMGTVKNEDLSTAYEELEDLVYSVNDAQINRKIKINGRWFNDFASCNYLGFDLEENIMKKIYPYVKEWGIHPSWTRAVCSPKPYSQLEDKLTKLVGCKNTIVFPTVTLTMFGILPALVSQNNGVLFFDQYAHESIQEAAQLCQAKGNQVVMVRHNSPTHLDEVLTEYDEFEDKVVVIDGVYSMGNAIHDIPEYIKVIRKHNAILVVDDSHGFGVIGENPTTQYPYGRRGNGTIKYFGLSYDNIIYVGQLSKAYSSMGAFVSYDDDKYTKVLLGASTLVFTGPIPTASLASAIGGVEQNEIDGDKRRLKMYKMTKLLVKGCRALGYTVDNYMYMPIVVVIIGKTSKAVKCIKYLWQHGIIITPAVYPAMPKNREGIRFSITTANTPKQIQTAIKALKAFREEKIPSSL